jgi:hypothetical protein
MMTLIDLPGITKVPVHVLGQPTATDFSAMHAGGVILQDDDAD